jgi:hypothetical protein
MDRKLAYLDFIRLSLFLQKLSSADPEAADYSDFSFNDGDISCY